MDPQPYDENGYYYSLVHGKKYPAFIDEKAVDDLRANFALRRDDVVIATFPKCGTTWMQQIVLCLMNQGNAGKVHDCMKEAPWLEWCAGFHFLGKEVDVNGKPMSVDELNAWSGETEYGPGPNRRCFKTHAPVELVPWKGDLDALGGAKVIVVARNPKDACVSYYHHVKHVPEAKYNGDFRHFALELFAESEFSGGGFWQWYADWGRAAAANENVLWTTYEALKRDGPAEVRRIAAFLGIPVDDDVVAGVLGGADFQAMRKQRLDLDAKRREQGLYVKDEHFRQGFSGAWRRSFTGELNDLFDEVHEKHSAKFGLTCQFDFGDDPFDQDSQLHEKSA